MPTYQVDFIARAKAHEEADGFDMVFIGEVVISENNRKMSVYEKDDYLIEGEQASPVFTTHLQNIDSVKCRRFRSAHGSYNGGRVQVFGTFDRSYQEKLTFKLHADEFKPFVDILSSLLKNHA
jgi:hypothetical protein